MVKKVPRSAEKFSEPFPISPLPLYLSAKIAQKSQSNSFLGWRLVIGLFWGGWCFGWWGEVVSGVGVGVQKFRLTNGLLFWDRGAIQVSEFRR